MGNPKSSTHAAGQPAEVRSGAPVVPSPNLMHPVSVGPRIYPTPRPYRQVADMLLAAPYNGVMI